jgi:cysteine desulfurase
LNNRIYLDYNSTSPLAKNVIDYLSKGDFPFQNPASIHQGGKSALKELNQARNEIFKKFHLDPNVYDLIFHSGATEFINTFFQFSENDLFIYSPADHKATLEQVSKAHHSHQMKIDTNGDFDLEDLKAAINQHKKQFPLGKILINYLWVHNETGVLWPLEQIKEFKTDNVYVHVDAVQSVGKIAAWDRPQCGDVLTYSAHKFGALKGIGFSFIKKDTPFTALIRGGNQQHKRRAGTENVMGAQSIVLALDEVQFDKNILKLRDELEQIVKSISHCEIIGENSKFGRNNNTLNFIDKNNKADLNLIKFDMQGIDLSSGSACTAGALEPSHTLCAYGYEEFAKHGIRVSLGAESIQDKTEILNKFKQIFES